MVVFLEVLQGLNHLSRIHKCFCNVGFVFKLSLPLHRHKPTVTQRSGKEAQFGQRFTDVIVCDGDIHDSVFDSCPPACWQFEDLHEQNVFGNESLLQVIELKFFWGVLNFQPILGAQRWHLPFHEMALASMAKIQFAKVEKMTWYGTDTIIPQAGFFSLKSFLP